MEMRALCKKTHLKSRRNCIANQTSLPTQIMQKAERSMNKKTGIQFNHSEYRWDTAESAASFVLRYICTLRKFIHQGLQHQEFASLILNDLVQQLVNTGYQNTTYRHLRDYLIFSIKEHSTNRLKESTQTLSKEEAIKWINEDLKPNSTKWLQCWRDSLLERAWRSLERLEHNEPQTPLYSIFHAFSVKPSASLSMLNVELATTVGLRLTEHQIGDLLSEAKITFAQLIVDEISETISNSSRENILQEVQTLGLHRALENLHFSGH